MKTEFDDYKRIGKGFLGMSSLWMGPDHLLYIKGSGFGLPFREEYRRFRYQDIQSVATLKTSGHWGLALLFLILFLINAAIAYAILAGRDPDSNAGLIWTLALPLPIGLVALVMLVRNFVLGPRCVCDIETALKTERLAPLSRLPEAEQALELIDARIRESQTSLLKTSDGNAIPGELFAQAWEVPKSAIIAFFASIIGGVLLLLIAHFQIPGLVIALVVVLFAGVIAVLTGLSSSLRRPCPESVRISLWAVLASILSFAVTGPVYYAVVAFDDPVYTVDLMGPFEALSALSSQGSLIFYLIFVVLGSVLALAGVVGLIKSLLRGKTS